MFNFFKSIPQVGEIWVYLPSFPDSDRGSTVEIIEVGKDAVKIKSITGRPFKQYQDKKDFLRSFKKFK
jgi:hypothetical protein